MTALRRHVSAAAWSVLGAQTLAIALGTAQLCWPGEHVHGSVAVPDCLMHHQARAGSEAMHHHSHHGRTASSDAGNDGGAKVSCRCGSDSVSVYPGQAAVLRAMAPWAPFIPTVMLDVRSDASLADLWFSPPSPPPR